MKLITVGCLLAGGLCLSAAQNITPLAPKKGVWSLGFDFDYFKTQHTDATTSINATPSYFFADGIEIIVPFGWTHSTGNDTSMIGVGARYYFMSKTPSQFQPFVGAVWESSHASGGVNDTFLGGEIGAHYFLANNVAATGTFVIGTDRSGGVSESTTQFHIGLTFFFAGVK